MENPRFFAASLKSEDCRTSAELYAKLFLGKILHSSPGHAEVLFSETHLLVFSRESADCPVSPGTVVWKMSRSEAGTFFSKLEEAGFRKEAVLEKYSSYLDPWGNRNWIYF